MAFTLRGQEEGWSALTIHLKRTVENKSKSKI